MSVLILSMPGDAHALSVKWALENRGVDAHLVCWSDFPQRFQASYSIAGGGGSSAALGDLSVSDITAIWNHRTMKAIPPQEIALADHRPILDGSEILMKGLVAMVEEHAFAVNPSAAKWQADNKLTQLRIAQREGFRIPKTLISNDVAEIKRFTNALPRTILKPLRFMRWRGEDETITLYTDRTPDLERFDPRAIQACPMIYQEEIEKRMEMRVVVFGGEMIPFELHSQDDQRSGRDWRAISYRDLPARLGSLDEATLTRVKNVVQTLGLVSGSVDLAITPEGEVVFFEINETGQFLWLEETCAEVPLLDIFAEFLISRNPDFKYDWNRRPDRFADWHKQGLQSMRNDIESRVPAILDKRYPDRVQ